MATRKHFLKLTVCASLFWCAAVGVSAAPITVIGTNLDLTYDSGLLGSFGTPTLVGDSLFFTLNEQYAESINGAGTNTLTSLLTGVTLKAKNGFRFGALDLAVFGDYRLQGRGSSVDVGGQLRAFDTALPGAATATASLQLAGGMALTAGNGSNQDWAAFARIDADTGAGGSPNVLAAGVGDVGLEIDVVLSAYSDPTQAGLRQAFIESKFSGLRVNISRADAAPLSAPATWGLVLPLLLGLLGHRACSDLARRRA